MNKRLIWHDKEIADVMDLLVECRNRDEVGSIFDNVLTTREINDIARRYKVLKMISEGSTYADIKIATGMSATAISRLSLKCGFGFEKSAKLTKKKITTYRKRTRTIRYKGVRIN